MGRGRGGERERENVRGGRWKEGGKGARRKGMGEVKVIQRQVL